MEPRQFIRELKSRGVYRTAALYCAGAWALLQVADVIFPVVGFPDWTITAVLVLAAMGFPVALVVAWVFDLTAHGVVETPEVESSPEAPHWSTAHVLQFTLIVLLSGLVGYLYVERLTSRPADPMVPVAGALPSSIAVMPFINISAEEELDYLGDGLAEEILNLLARLNELNVAARTSSFYFKGKDVDIQDIGEHLGVAHVLEGSVRYQDGTVRVTAQLIKTVDGFHVWSQNYDRELGDLLALQDEIAAEVVRNLQVLLSAEAEDLFSGAGRIDPQAYDYYLRARAYLRKPSDESNLRYAVELFDKAIALEGQFADAYAGKCDALLGLYSIGYDMAHFEAAESSCQQALRRDRRAVAVYIALGRLYLASGQHDKALEEFETALELGAAAAEAQLGYADVLASMNDYPAAERHYLKALTQQPNYWRALTAMGNFLVESGRVEEAIPYFQRVTELMPDSDLAVGNLGAVLFMDGDFEAASRAWQRSLQLSPSAITYSNIGTSLFYLRRFDEAADLFRQALELTPENFELWGNLADTLRHAGEVADQWRPLYERALTLGRQRLDVNPADAYTIALLSHYLAVLGQHELAVELLDNALEAAPEDVNIAYVCATALAEAGQVERSLQVLELALENGFPAHFTKADANLDVLKDLPRFGAMVSGG